MGDLGSVFVTGGCGLLGYHVVKYLLDSGEAREITILDVSVEYNRIDDPKVKYISGSITSKNLVFSAMKEAKTDVIIHTASPDPLYPNPKVLEEVNIDGTRNLIDCAVELGIKVFVLSSSSEVVQNSYDDIILANESTPLPENPVDGSVYARSKKIGEEIVLAANNKNGNGLLTTTIRLCTLFGENDRVLTRHMIRVVREGRAKYRVGSGKNLYDFIYAGNAAEGHVLAAKKLLEESRTGKPGPAGRVNGEVFFMTNGESWPFWEFSRAVARELGTPISDHEIWAIPLGIVLFFVRIYQTFVWVFTGGSPKITTNMLRYTAEVRTFDMAKAEKRLGFRPRVSMSEGVRRAVEWNLEDFGESKKAI